MLNELACTCEGCDRDLREEDCAIRFETEAGQRRAYECSCGTVTITVHR